MLLNVRLLAEILLLTVSSVLLCSHVMQLIEQLFIQDIVLQTKNGFLSFFLLVSILKSSVAARYENKLSIETCLYL